MLDRLADRVGVPGWVAGVLAAVVLMLGGRAVLDRVLPGGARGAEVGWAVFVVLTGLAAERAEGAGSGRFWAWVAAGGVVGVLVGAVCRGLAGGGG